MKLLVKKSLSIILSLIMLTSLCTSLFSAFAGGDGEPVSECNHYYVWKVDFEATADRDGQMRLYCVYCGKVCSSKSFTLHTHTEGYRSVTRAPFCETAGEGGVFCATCGAIYDTFEIEPLGHTGGSSTTFTSTNNEVVFLIDESGSMSSNDPDGIRIDVSKTLTDKLGANDKEAVVLFDNSTRVMSELTTDKTAVKTAIEYAGEYGGTDMYNGLKVAFQRFNGTSNAKRYIIMLTDGVSYGSFDYATEAAEKNVIIHVVGLGRGVNEAELKTIANTTGGKYYFAEAADDLFDIYEEIGVEITSHSGAWVTTIVPTCTTVGEKVCFCSRCGKAIDTEEIPVLEHKFETNIYLNEESHTGHCTNCGKDIESLHEWTEWEFNNDNSFFVDGTQTRYCLGCDKHETERAKHTAILTRFFYPIYNVILKLFNKMPINWIDAISENC